jgi:hypothetical protein
MKPWTQADLRTLRTLAPTHARSQIAAILGRTPGAGGDKAQRLGIPLLPPDRSRHSWEVVDAIRTAHEQGAKPAALAKQYGIPYWTIRSYVYYYRRLG